DRRRRRSGSFAVEILGKRLLSCPTAFAESWRRSKEGMTQEEAAGDREMEAAARGVRQETGDDREAQKREETAAGVVGAWLKAMAGELQDEIAEIDQALHRLGIDSAAGEITDQDPEHDARFDALCRLIDDLVRKDDTWRDDERLVVFTEYKTTLDYLVRRLRRRYEDERILMLYGGMEEPDRDRIKAAFNDPAHAVRILMATDAAAEGLNLQRTARYLLHFDCPWNPSKLEQRNGRLDRHGQARDVTIHHFVSNEDHDLRFLAHVIHKADEIREDLGSANELFDEATHRRLVEGDDVEDVRLDLDQKIAGVRQCAEMPGDATLATGPGGGAAPQDLQAIAAELDLDPRAMRNTLEASMAIGAGRPQLACDEEILTCRILNPELAGWSEVIDDSLRRRTGSDSRGPVAGVAFSAEPFLETWGGRRVFRPKSDTLLMHLSHPMFQKALSSLTRCRFPGSEQSASRWTVRRGGVPAGAGALVLLSVEELAVNDLRESFHHWVRTVAFPVTGGRLGDGMPHRPAIDLRCDDGTPARNEAQEARDLFDEIEPVLKTFLTEHARRLTTELQRQLERDYEQARNQEDQRYRSRLGEVSSLIAGNTIKKLEQEIERLKEQRRQGQLFGQADELEKIDRSIEERKAEVERRKTHLDSVREQLDRERERVVKYLLPKRHSMTGSAQVFPVSVEIRLPGGDA
ncbi:MAG: DNA helicase, partial [Candidatus Eisenbacteria bacterium]|nr:DNA helicase [Candidatus Eisenbacteria bacterium]